MTASFLRKLIIEHVRRCGHRNGRGSWVLDVYCELLKNGAEPEEAAREMSSFVDDIIAAKERRQKLELVDDGTPVGN